MKLLEPFSIICFVIMASFAFVAMPIKMQQRSNEIAAEKQRLLESDPEDEYEEIREDTK